jgi:hypothetical protein
MVMRGIVGKKRLSVGLPGRELAIGRFCQWFGSKAIRTNSFLAIERDALKVTELLFLSIWARGGEFRG